VPSLYFIASCILDVHFIAHIYSLRLSFLACLSFIASLMTLLNSWGVILSICCQYLDNFISNCFILFYDHPDNSCGPICFLASRFRSTFTLFN
jgi:hypothetical protein